MCILQREKQYYYVLLLFFYTKKGVYMKYNFLIYAEKKLNNEALRIFPMAKKTFFQGKSVSSLIQKMIKKEYS